MKYLIVLIVVCCSGCVERTVPSRYGSMDHRIRMLELEGKVRSIENWVNAVMGAEKLLKERKENLEGVSL